MHGTNACFAQLIWAYHFYCLDSCVCKYQVERYGLLACIEKKRVVLFVLPLTYYVLSVFSHAWLLLNRHWCVCDLRICCHWRDMNDAWRGNLEGFAKSYFESIADLYVEISLTYFESIADLWCKSFDVFYFEGFADSCIESFADLVLCMSASILFCLQSTDVFSCFDVESCKILSMMLDFYGIYVRFNLAPFCRLMFFVH